MPFPCPRSLSTLTYPISPRSSLDLPLFALFRPVLHVQALLPRNVLPTWRFSATLHPFIPCVPTRFLSVAPATSFHVILFSHYLGPSCLRCPSVLASFLSSFIPGRRRFLIPRGYSRSSSKCSPQVFPSVSAILFTPFCSDWITHDHLANPSRPVFLLGRSVYEPLTYCSIVVLLCFKPPSSFFLFFLPVIYLRVPCIFVDYARESSLSVSLKRRFSRACLPILFFFLHDVLSLPLLLSLFFLFPRELAFRPLPRGRGSPQLDFPRFAYFLLHSLHSTYGCQRSRGISPPTSHLTRQRQPCVRTFFSARRIFATHESGFLSDPYSLAFILHASKCRPSPVSSTTIMSQVISACISLSSFRPLVLSLHLFLLVSPHDISLHIAYSRIISRVISRVSRVILFSPFPRPLPQRAFAVFALHLVQPPYARYTEYLLFLGVLHPSITSVLESATTSSSRSTSCSTYDDGTQLHYRQQLRLEASTTRPRSDK